MAILVATPGSPLANSYTTVSQATAFLTMRLHTDAWTTASVPDQEAALMWATQLLDEQMRWAGIPTYPDQALALPQTGLVDQWGRMVLRDVIPVPVQQATALYALGLLEVTAATTTGGGTAALVVKSKKIGDTTIVYQDVPVASARAPASPYALSSEVRALLRPYGLVPGLGAIPVLRT